MEVRRSELHSECVVELLHGDFSVSVVVKSSHQGMFFVIRDEYVQRSESLSELLEVNHTVIVLVKFLKQVNGEILKRGVVLRQFLDLENDLVHGSFWELVWIIFHVFLGVFVGRNGLEFESTQEYGPSDEEVLLSIVSLSDW